MCVFVVVNTHIYIFIYHTNTIMFGAFKQTKSFLLPRLRLSVKAPCMMFQGSMVGLLDKGVSSTGNSYENWCNSQIRFRSNRSRRGLYDGKDVRTGNNVSFSMRHTKRKFRPNVFIKRVYSEVLDAMIPFHITTSALRSIDKAGGLDNYLLQNDITEGEGYKIKKFILKRMKLQTHFARKAGNASSTETSSNHEDDATASIEPKLENIGTVEVKI
jgi:large subunit ribosomal protein L28